MAQRVYRHDLRCPHCGSNWLPKYGRPRGKQAYRCGDCRYKFTPEGNRHYYSEEVKRRAMSMYGEGSSMSAIARVLGVKLGTVYSWVKKSPLGNGSNGYAASAEGNSEAGAAKGQGHILGRDVDIRGSETKGASTGALDMDGGSGGRRRQQMDGL